MTQGRCSPNAPFARLGSRRTDVGHWFIRALGVQRLLVLCLNDACRHTALIDVSSYPADTEVLWFRSRVVCAKCGSRGNHIDVRPNWKEQSTQPSLTGKVWR
jgi:hypothetical protein